MPNPNSEENIEKIIYVPFSVKKRGEYKLLNLENWKELINIKHIFNNENNNMNLLKDVMYKNVYGGIICPSGYYCPAKALHPYLCPTGAVRLHTGGRWASDCTECPPGYYCPENSTIPILCPKGHFCMHGTKKPTPCNSPFFNPHEGKESISACVPCTEGFICKELGSYKIMCIYFACTNIHCLSQ